MKKLMIAAAIVCAAAFAQAASVDWKSGSFKTAADAEGGWSSTSIRNNYDSLAASLFIIDSATYTELSGKSQAEIYAAYSSKTPTGTATASGATSTSLTISSTDHPINTSQYAVLIYEYTDKTLAKDFYMAGVATIDGSTITNPGNTYNVANIATDIADWQAAAVPEPTSGLLLLLGVAGLALRRRRA